MTGRNWGWSLGNLDLGIRVWGCIVSRDSGLQAQNNKARSRKEAGKLNGNWGYIWKDGLGSRVLPKA